MLSTVTVSKSTKLNLTPNSTVYVKNSLITGLVGGVSGGFAPSIGSVLSNAGLWGSSIFTEGAIAVGTITDVTVIGSAAVVGSSILYASNERPHNNKKQNKQFNDAMRELRITDKDKMRRVHDAIKGKNMGYRELIEFIKSVLNKR